MGSWLFATKRCTHPPLTLSPLWCGHAPQLFSNQLQNFLWPLSGEAFRWIGQTLVWLDTHTLLFHYCTAVYRCTSIYSACAIWQPSLFAFLIIPVLTLSDLHFMDIKQSFYYIWCVSLIIYMFHPFLKSVWLVHACFVQHLYLYVFCWMFLHVLMTTPHPL